MRYEEPNMEIIFLYENTVVTTSGLIVDENGGSNGKNWSDLF